MNRNSLQTTTTKNPSWISQTCVHLKALLISTRTTRPGAYWRWESCSVPQLWILGGPFYTYWLIPPFRYVISGRAWETFFFLFFRCRKAARPRGEEENPTVVCANKTTPTIVGHTSGTYIDRVIIGLMLRAKSTPRVWRAVCTGPGYIWAGRPSLWTL